MLLLAALRAASAAAASPRAGSEAFASAESGVPAVLIQLALLLEALGMPPVLAPAPSAAAAAAASALAAGWTQSPKDVPSSRAAVWLHSCLRPPLSAAASVAATPAGITSELLDVVDLSLPMLLALPALLTGPLRDVLPTDQSSCSCSPSITSGSSGTLLLRRAGVARWLPVPPSLVPSAELKLPDSRLLLAGTNEQWRPSVLIQPSSLAVAAPWAVGRSCELATRAASWSLLWRSSCCLLTVRLGWDLRPPLELRMSCALGLPAGAMLEELPPGTGTIVASGGVTM